MAEVHSQRLNRLARSPAFPVVADACSAGMSLRDYIAIQIYIGTPRQGSDGEAADAAIQAAKNQRLKRTIRSRNLRSSFSQECYLFRHPVMLMAL